MPTPNLEALVETLIGLPHETEWLEFKQDRFDPKEFGEYVSALSNSAILNGRPSAYLVYGIADGTHEVVGTSVDLAAAKVGNEAFLNWLPTRLDPRPRVLPEVCQVGGHRVVVVTIAPAFDRPVKFDRIEYIRNGPHKRLLSDFPESERALWQATSRFTFERSIASHHVTPADVIDLLDVDGWYELRREPRPTTAAAIIDRLTQERLIASDMQNRYDVTNLALIAFGRDLEAFEPLSRRAVRVIRYRGTGKLETIEERVVNVGYAVAFRDLLRTVLTMVPSREEVVEGLRRNQPMVPEIALREALANALVHQDLTDLGAGPVVEIFSDRVEITNPGRPLVDTDRLLDAPPRSRNEALGALLRRLGICEQRGSGIDKIVASVEDRTLPAPLFRDTPNATVVTLFAERPFDRMTTDEKVRACYQHACLRHAEADAMSNTSLRRRLGLRDEQHPQASLLIKVAIDAGRIKPLTEGQAKRNARYVPFFA